MSLLDIPCERSHCWEHLRAELLPTIPLGLSSSITPQHPAPGLERRQTFIPGCIGVLLPLPAALRGGMPRTPGHREPQQRLEIHLPRWHGHWDISEATHPVPPSTWEIRTHLGDPPAPKLSRWLIWCGTSVEDAGCASKRQRAGDFHYFEKPFCVSTETKQTTYHLTLCKSARGGSSEIHINW